MYMKQTNNRNVATDASNVAATRGRESRQQGGDTYTLEITFPAVKYVPFMYKFHTRYFIKNVLVASNFIIIFKYRPCNIARD